jgi:hypothetical protein
MPDQMTVSANAQGVTHYLTRGSKSVVGPAIARNSGRPKYRILRLGKSRRHECRISSGFQPFSAACQISKARLEWTFVPTKWAACSTKSAEEPPENRPGSLAQNNLFAAQFDLCGRVFFGRLHLRPFL